MKAVPYIYEFYLEGFFDNVGGGSAAQPFVCTGQLSADEGGLNYIKRICQEDLGGVCHHPHWFLS